MFDSRDHRLLEAILILAVLAAVVERHPGPAAKFFRGFKGDPVTRALDDAGASLSHALGDIRAYTANALQEKPPLTCVQSAVANGLGKPFAEVSCIGDDIERKLELAHPTGAQQQQISLAALALSKKEGLGHTPSQQDRPEFASDVVNQIVQRVQRNAHYPAAAAANDAHALTVFDSRLSNILALKPSRATAHTY